MLIQCNSCIVGCLYGVSSRYPKKCRFVATIFLGMEPFHLIFIRLEVVGLSYYM
jgi:hypothetical protein